MYRRSFLALAGLLAVAAFALTPATASAQRRGVGGAYYGGGSWRGGTTAWDGNWRDGGWGRDGWGWNRGWGWGVGLGLGYPWYGGYRYGYGYSPGYDYAYTPYYSGDTSWYSGSYPSYGWYSGGYPYYGDTGNYYGSGFGDMSSGYGSMGYGYGTAGSQDNAARVRVIVPPDAKVWFGNSATEQTGQVRFFQSPELSPGKEYTYDVKAQWRDQNGKDVTQSRQVVVRANAGTTVDFMQPMSGTTGSSGTGGTSGTTRKPGTVPPPPSPGTSGTPRNPGSTDRPPQ
jgi:uncharacterized protein (TIGR03000 family)